MSQTQARRTLGKFLAALLLCSVFWQFGAVAQDLETNLPPANTNQLTLPIFGTPTVQSGPAPATGYPGMTAAPPLAGTTQLAGAPPVTQLPPVPLLRLGPVILHPHLDYNVSYGNSLQPLPGQQVNTVVNSISPGIFLGLGDHWGLDYTPTLRYYSSRRFQDGVDHIVNLSGGTTYGDWTFGLSQGYASTSQPLSIRPPSLTRKCIQPPLTRKTGWVVNSPWI